MKKRVIISLIVAVAVSMCVVLTSCGETNEKSSTPSSSSVEQYDIVSGTESVTEEETLAESTTEKTLAEEVHIKLRRGDKVSELIFLGLVLLPLVHRANPFQHRPVPQTHGNLPSRVRFREMAVCTEQILRRKDVIQIAIIIQLPIRGRLADEGYPR